MPTREDLQREHHTWTARAATNRHQAIALVVDGDLIGAEWHRDEAKRCEHIASDLRTEIQRLADTPTVGLQAQDILREMLLLEDLGKAKWDPTKGDWTPT